MISISKFAAIAFFVAAVFTFSFGYHNVDLMFNAANMDLNIVDINFFGTIQTITDGYLSGIAMLFFSLVFFIVSFLLLLAGDIDFKYHMKHSQDNL